VAVPVPIAFIPVRFIARLVVAGILLNLRLPFKITKPFGRPNPNCPDVAFTNGIDYPNVES
jgi:hypothetical protein